jgi:hypothetical protein
MDLALLRQSYSAHKGTITASTGSLYPEGHEGPAPHIQRYHARSNRGSRN